MGKYTLHTNLGLAQNLEQVADPFKLIENERNFLKDLANISQLPSNATFTEIDKNFAEKGGTSQFTKDLIERNWKIDNNQSTCVIDGEEYNFKVISDEGKGQILLKNALNTREETLNLEDFINKIFTNTFADQFSPKLDKDAKFKIFNAILHNLTQKSLATVSSHLKQEDIVKFAFNGKPIIFNIDNTQVRWETDENSFKYYFLQGKIVFEFTQALSQFDEKNRKLEDKDLAEVKYTTTYNLSEINDLDDPKNLPDDLSDTVMEITPLDPNLTISSHVFQPELEKNQSWLQRYILNPVKSILVKSSAFMRKLFYKFFIEPKSKSRLIPAVSGLNINKINLKYLSEISIDNPESGIACVPIQIFSSNAKNNLAKQTVVRVTSGSIEQDFTQDIDFTNQNLIVVNPLVYNETSKDLLEDTAFNLTAILETLDQKTKDGTIKLNAKFDNLIIRADDALAKAVCCEVSSKKNELINSIFQLSENPPMLDVIQMPSWMPKIFKKASNWIAVKLGLLPQLNQAKYNEPPQVRADYKRNIEKAQKEIEGLAKILQDLKIAKAAELETAEGKEDLILSSDNLQKIHDLLVGASKYLNLVNHKKSLSILKILGEFFNLDIDNSATPSPDITLRKPLYPEVLNKLRQAIDNQENLVGEVGEKSKDTPKAKNSLAKPRARMNFSLTKDDGFEHIPSSKSARELSQKLRDL